MFLTLLLTATVLLVGCKSDSTSLDMYKDEKNVVVEDAKVSEKSETTLESTEIFKQFRKAEVGDVVATMVTNFGQIDILFFPEAAPKAVENFTTHAKEGYYDGVTFHRVVNDFMIQGGDPLGTGTGGESIWGEDFEDEINRLYFPFRGALCMANAGSNTNSSQFFIVQKGDPAPNIIDVMTENGYPSEMIKAYENNGGTDWLYGKHTVFGQVTSGMDVVDAIAATPVDPKTSRPDEAVIIESITVSIIE